VGRLCVLVEADAGEGGKGDGRRRAGRSVGATGVAGDEGLVVEDGGGGSLDGGWIERKENDVREAPTREARRKEDVPVSISSTIFLGADFLASTFFVFSTTLAATAATAGPLDFFAAINSLMAATDASACSILFSLAFFCSAAATSSGLALRTRAFFVVFFGLGLGFESTARMVVGWVEVSSISAGCSTLEAGAGDSGGTTMI
jgi:hypothetical protein